MPSRPLLLQVLLEPPLLPRLLPPEQTLVLRQARQAALLGYIEARIGKRDEVGPRLAEHLTAGRVHALYHDRMIAWETKRLGRALASLPGPVILLKGAAYKALDLGLAAGRLASDVDLLLPREQLEEAERLLAAAGWEPMKEDDYEQRYYREWMHELPPLRHRERGTVVDLHHTILPLTSRLRPDPARLIAAAVPMADGPFHVLCPEDNLLHRAVHLFHDGDLENGLRELLDIHGMFGLYSEQEGFQQRLLARAGELGLGRPLFYAAHFCRRLFDTPLDASLVRDLARHAPPAPVRGLACWLMEKALLPEDPDRPSRSRRLAQGLLFLRSHWLRMPPLLLARHLLTQAWRRGGLKTG